MTRRSVLSWWTWSLASVLVHGPAFGATISLEEALSSARQANPEILVARAGAEAAEARVGEVRSYLLPEVKAAGNALQWNGALEAQIFTKDPCAGIDDFIKKYCTQMVSQFSEPLLLRDARTEQISVTLTQPLSSLWTILEGWKATRAQARAEQAHVDATGASVEVQVVETWLLVARTKRLTEVARTAMDAMQAHEKRAEAFAEEGLLGRNDILRLQVAASDATLDWKRALVGKGLASRGLAILIGSSDRNLEPEELDLEKLPSVDWNPERLDSAVAGVADQRALRADLQAAAAARRKAVADLLPQVGAVANWTRNWGLGTMSAGEEGYVGLGVEWEWAWGRRFYAAKAAGAQRRQASIGLDGSQASKALEAEKALREAELSREAVDAGRTSRTAAEENLRIIDTKYEVLTASTTDLLEAETLATKARADEAVAVYDYYLAVARAQASLGIPVDPRAGVDLR